MRNGFIFDHDLCVACKACSAACMIENEWSFKARNIYTNELAGQTSGRTVNISMACNHCNEPSCLQGCPSNAYSKDPDTGSVTLEPEKCIGCRYCTWNCPYNSPVINEDKRIIEKCHFCHHRILLGEEPACSSACPTGALKYGEITSGFITTANSWIPEKKLDPSLMIRSNYGLRALKIVPDKKGSVIVNYPEVQNTVKDHWSLIAFSFLLTCAVSFNIASINGNMITGRFLPLILMIAAGILSLFHLGLPLKAHRSVINGRTSALSREIILYIITLSLFAVNIAVQNAPLKLAGVITGFIMLMAVDHVYNYSDRSITIMLHSGQTFLTSLLISAYFMGSIIPFLFIALLKSIFIFYMILRKRNRQNLFRIRFTRIALLIITSFALISGTELGRFTGIIIFLSGELIDRAIYYLDFNPENISRSIYESIKLK